MANKRITSKQYSDMVTSVRLSSHEKLCSERMKALIKTLDELKRDVKEMNKWKGAGGIIILLGGLIGSVFYFFMK